MSGRHPGTPRFLYAITGQLRGRLARTALPTPVHCTRCTHLPAPALAPFRRLGAVPARGRQKEDFQLTCTPGLRWLCGAAYANGPAAFESDPGGAREFGAAR